MNQATSKEVFLIDEYNSFQKAERPSEKDAELAHPLSSYRYQMKFNSDKYVLGGIVCF